MDRRLEGMLHRWLPWVAGVAIGVAGINNWIVETAVSKAVEAERQARESEDPAVPAKPPDPALVEAGAGAVLEQVARLVRRLDSDVQTQRILAEAFAQNDTIQRLWVVDERGYIAYYAKEQPAARTVEVLAAKEVHALLETLPAGLLRPDQRLAILTAAAIQRSEDRGDRPERYVRPSASPWPPGGMEGLHTRLLPIKGGLIAVATAAPPPHRETSSPAVVQIWRDTDNLTARHGKILVVACLLYWLSIPLWVVLDALRHRERAIVWGLFTLIGNIVALLIYLLSRSRTEEQVGK